MWMRSSEVETKQREGIDTKSDVRSVFSQLRMASTVSVPESGLCVGKNVRSGKIVENDQFSNGQVSSMTGKDGFWGAMADAGG